MSFAHHYVNYPLKGHSRGGIHVGLRGIALVLKKKELSSSSSALEESSSISSFKLHFMGKILAKIHSRQSLYSLRRALGRGEVLGEVKEWFTNAKSWREKTARSNRPAAHVPLSQHSLLSWKKWKK